MFSLSRNFLKFAAASTFVAITTVSIPASAEEMIQHLGPVAPQEPLLATVGNKNVIAFFGYGNNQCDVHAVIWNADDMEAKSAAGVRLSLQAGENAPIKSGHKSLTLRCGDDAETLTVIDTDQRLVSK
jgi:hypothetical protein